MNTDSAVALFLFRFRSKPQQFLQNEQNHSYILIPSSRVVLTDSESSEVWSIQSGLLYTSSYWLTHCVNIQRLGECDSLILRLFSDWLNEIPGQAQLGPRVEQLQAAYGGQ